MDVVGRIRLSNLLPHSRLKDDGSEDSQCHSKVRLSEGRVEDADLNGCEKHYEQNLLANKVMRKGWDGEFSITTPRPRPSLPLPVGLLCR